MLLFRKYSILVYLATCLFVQTNQYIQSNFQNKYIYRWNNYKSVYEKSSSPSYHRSRRNFEPNNSTTTNRPETTTLYSYESSNRRRYNNQYILPSIRSVRTQQLNDNYQMQRDGGRSLLGWQSLAMSKPMTRVCRSCGVPLLQDSFCNDEFTFKGYIYNVTRRGLLDIEYKVYVEEVYRDRKPFGQLKKCYPVLITYDCSRTNEGLKIFKSYLLTGNYFQEKAYVDSCSYLQEFSQISWYQQNYLEKFYTKQCRNCKIQRVFQSNYHQSFYNQKNICYVSVDNSKNQYTCIDSYSLCRFDRAHNRCKLTTNKALKHCTNYS